MTEPGTRAVRTFKVTDQLEYTLFCQWPHGPGCRKLGVEGDGTPENTRFTCCGEGNWRVVSSKESAPVLKIQHPGGIDPADGQYVTIEEVLKEHES